MYKQHEEYRINWRKNMTAYNFRGIIKEFVFEANLFKYIMVRFHDYPIINRILTIL